MGLFMDGNGLPLALSVFPGNHNEQPSLVPLEKQILTDFNLSKFIVCTCRTCFSGKPPFQQSQQTFLCCSTVIEAYEDLPEGMGIGSIWLEKAER